MVADPGISDRRRLMDPFIVKALDWRLHQANPSSQGPIQDVYAILGIQSRTQPARTSPAKATSSWKEPSSGDNALQGRCPGILKAEGTVHPRRLLDLPTLEAGWTSGQVHLLQRPRVPEMHDRPLCPAVTLYQVAGPGPPTVHEGSQLELVLFSIHGLA